MKKHIKSYYLIILLAVLFPTITNAEISKMAIDLCDPNTVYNVTYSGNTTIVNFNGGIDYKLNFYNTKASGSNVDFKTYCLSPGAAGPKGRQYKCSYILDPTGATTGSGEIGKKRQALAIAAQYTYQQIKGKSDEDNRIIGEIVLRWLSLNYAGPVAMHKSLGETIAKRYISYFQPIDGGDIPDIWNSATINGNNALIREATDIYLAAKALADQVYFGHKKYEDLVGNGEGKIAGPSYDLEKVGEPTKEGNVTKQKFKIHIYDSSVEIPSLEEAQVKCEGTGVSCKITDIDASMGNRREFILEVTNAPASGYKAYLTFKLNNSNLAMSNFMMLEPANNVKAQTMLVAFEESVGFTDFAIPLEGKAGTSSGKCEVKDGKFYDPDGKETTEDDFYDKCCDQVDPDSDEYKKYCSCGDPDLKFEGKCDDFDVPESTITNYVRDTKSDANLKQCLFRPGSGDSAKNKYQMTDQAIVASNKYCKVSCIEDYEFKLPTAKYTRSGHYFTLSTKVSGKRTCYVNANEKEIPKKDYDKRYDGINTALFNTDLENARRAVITAYNNYLKWKAATEITSSSETLTCSYSGRQESRDPVTNALIQSACSAGSDSKTGYKKTWTYYQYNIETGERYSATSSYGPGSTSDGECSCSISASSNQDNTHRDNYNGAINSLNSALANLKNIITSYNDCTGNITATVANSIGFDAGSSTGWKNDFKFGPEIEFKYEEPYYEMDKFDKLFKPTVNIEDKKSTSTTYYSGEVNSQYEGSGTSDVPTATKTLFICTTSGCENVNIKYSTAKYVKKESRVSEIEYKLNNDFYDYTPLGTIVLKPGTTDLYTLLCKENDCLPVSLNTPTGVFNFTFKFKDIGQYNDTNQLGRLMGGAPSKSSVFDAVGVAAAYVCHYINNCPDCTVSCEPDCEFDDPDPTCPDCPVECVDCIFDGKENTFFYRTVSLNNLLPSNRTYGPNWNTSTSDKAKTTIEEINKDSQSNENIYEEAQYSFTITPQQMREIRKYNSDAGSYLNTTMPGDGANALACEALTDNNGNTYANTACKSNFLRTNGNKYFTTNKINDTFTPWTGQIKDGVGPSWK